MDVIRSNLPALKYEEYGDYKDKLLFITGVAHYIRTATILKET